MPDRQEITHLLERWRHGESHALDNLFHMVYGDLKVNARSVLRLDAGNATLSATEVANEAYLRLIRYPMDRDRLPFESRKQFFGLVQKTMLHILVDHHRRKQAVRHGGGLTRVDLEEAGQQQAEEDPDLSHLERALGQLALVKPGWYHVIHQRFLSECAATVQQLAKALKVSEREVFRKTHLGLAWLRQRLQEG